VVIGDGEVLLAFQCFGGSCRVAVSRESDGYRRALEARDLLRRCHVALTRFEPGSELSRLNDDPREVVEASELMLGFVAAAIEAGEISGGLVDATVLGAVERAGYAASRPNRDHRASASVLDGAPERMPGSPSEAAAWRAHEFDRADGIVRRPAGVRLDSGGVAKGWAADRAAERLTGARFYAIDCAGDIRIGGAEPTRRQVRIADPFGGPDLRSIGVERGGVATSGISRRSWRHEGAPSHHLIDPGSGAPVFSGLVQVTALAGTAFEAEVRAKAALISGPEGAARMLPHGGLLVSDDGSLREIERAESTTIAQVAA
jgi:thiamine biosynthesis lipoprotein